MKKQNLKNLSLNKKSVSNLQKVEVIGGFDRETKTFFGGLCLCPAPSRADTASWCICL
ncbi:hypothetical protein H2O64_13105 [Kordia sp. YSTF-M3]|uniref:Natural product n=1 Tax=Kordia aestuariivivens TaxID=2759037 RepID=A0ABR7QAK8_9FLAO|nr:hypothetical protein [Kordia aestuariivivens]MBC8755609.1 hypothetical protein [Kordia aestuariivivens]